MSDKPERTEKLNAYWVVSVSKLEELIEKSKQNWRESTGTTRVARSHCLVLRFEDSYADDPDKTGNDGKTQLSLVRK